MVYDSVICDVIFARDKWLRPGGMILPDRGALYIAAIRQEDFPKGIEWWDYGKILFENMLKAVS